MRVVTQTDNIFLTFGQEKGMEMLAEAGFEAADYSMFFLTDRELSPIRCKSVRTHAQELLQLSEQYSLPFSQAHAPFPSYRFGDNEYNAVVFEQIKNAVQIAGLIGANQIVVHPIMCPETVDQKKFNLDFYSSLAPLCEEYGIKIALENMFTTDPRRGVKKVNVCSTGADLAEYVDALDPKHFTACLDIGHSGLVGDDSAHAIRTLGGSRLTCLHVHDNDYIDDNHFIPFSMKLDWENITGALKEIGYCGDMTLEADAFLSRMPKEAKASALRLMHDVAAVLVKMVETA